MIECIFTVDYEMYGNGDGSLHDHILVPMQRLAGLFRRFHAKAVVFVEVAELERIEREGTDSAIHAVKQQVRELREEGHEIGLHLHPQWYNARHGGKTWYLDYSEYNLCTLPEPRIAEILDRGIHYLQSLLVDQQFQPFSFRAGNWLLQPTARVADALSRRGIKVDSSVFQGGRQRAHALDYRQALKNGRYWPFGDDVTVPCPDGPLLEIPIHTEMVPFWRMATAKRLKLQQGTAGRRPSAGRSWIGILDTIRWLYPLKFDFCRMTSSEQQSMLAHVIREDGVDPSSYRPVVLIGHTKDAPDLDAITDLLCALRSSDIRTVTLQEAYPKCQSNAVKT